jgi:hypothetical protein
VWKPLLLLHLRDSDQLVWQSIVRKNLSEGRVFLSYFVSVVTVFVLMDSLRYPSCSAVAGATINSIFFEAPFSNTSGNEVSFS